MKRFSKIGQIVFTTLFVLSISLQGIQPAIAQGGDNVRISRNQHTGKVSFIGAAPGKPIHVQAAQMSGMAASERALALIQPYAADLGLTQPGRELKLQTTDKPKGRQVSKFQQTYQGIPVMAGELVVDATEQGELLSINGEIAPDLNIDTKATITAAQAMETALQSVAKWYEGKTADFQSTQPALWIYDARLLEPDGSAPALVWRLEVTNKNAGAPVRELILVDAHHGNISLHFNQDDTAWTSHPSVSLDEEPPTDTPIVDEPTATDVPTEETRPVPSAEAATEVPPLATETIVSTASPNTGAELQTTSATSPVYFELALDETRGWIYGSDSSGNKIDVISTSTLLRVKSFALVSGANPKGIALSPDGSELAIAQYGAGSILFLNPDTGHTITKVIPNVNGGLNEPWDVIYGRDGRMYSSGAAYSFGSDYIHVIDTAAHTEIARSSYFISAYPRLAISADKNTLYANETSSTALLYKFDISTDTILSRIYVSGSGFYAQSFILDPVENVIFTDSGQVWAADAKGELGSIGASGQVAYIPTRHAVAIASRSGVVFASAQNFYPLSTYKLPVQGITMGPVVAKSDGSRVFVSTSGGIFAVNLSAFPPGTPSTLPAGSLPYTDLVLDEPHGVLYGSNEYGHKIDVISMSTLQIVDQIRLNNGSAPGGMDLSPDGSELAVALKYGSSIAFINTATRTVSATLTGCPEAYDVVYGRAGRAYSIDSYGSFHVIDTATHTEVGKSQHMVGYPKLAISSDGNLLYLSESWDWNTLHLIDVSTDTVSYLRSVRVGGSPGTGTDFLLLSDNSKVFTNYGKVLNSSLTTELGTFSAAGYLAEAPGMDAVAVISKAKPGLVTFVSRADYHTLGSLTIPDVSSVRAGAVTKDSSKLFFSSNHGVEMLALSLSSPSIVSFPKGPTQSTRPLTMFPNPIEVQVLDLFSNPLAGVQVTFTAPVSGASGRFSNGTSAATVMTDGNGIANAGTFTANATLGAYRVQATVSGLSTPASVFLTNTNENISTYTMRYRIQPLPGPLVCNLSKPRCTNGANIDADHAQQYALDTYQYYQSHFHRNSVNNAGLPLISSVQYGTNYRNAFWNGAQMIYGDGYSAGLDVVGHELTHGVTQYSSRLFYYYQSGAINESLSDVFGELIEGFYNGATDNWRIGEKLPRGAIRSMSNPPQYGDPDKINSSLYYTGDDDNGGVHTNSGVNNKAAYLMVAGGTFNGVSVSGIGVNKTLAIYYEAQTRLLTSGSDYADLYDDLYQACINLVGRSSGITDADCQSVHNALDAVAMNAQPASSYNPEAPVCATGQTPVDKFFDNFESGAGKWSLNAFSDTQRWRLGSPYGVFAHSGTHFLYADDYPAANADVNVQMKTGVKIPANAYLHFAQAYDFEHYKGYSIWFDGGVLEYTIDNGISWRDAGSLMINNGYGGKIIFGHGNPLAGRKGFVGTSHGYTSTRLNLSSLAGKTVKFRWRMGLDNIGYSWGWWLDDVRIYTCSAPGKISPPQGATNLKATVALSWKPVSGAKSYDYCYDTTNDNACSTNWMKQGISTSVSISGLSPSTKYYWQVRANTAAGIKYADTNWWSFTTGPLPAAFAKAGPTNAAVDQTLNPILSWNAAVGATGYEYCTDTVDNNVCDGTWKPTAKTSASLAGLEVNSVTYWQVRAVNTFGPTEADGDAWYSFTTTPIVYTISGNAGAGGAALSYTDGGPVTALADGNGDYSLAVSPNWSGSVVPSRAGYIFLPTSLSYTSVTADQPGKDYTAHLLLSQSFQSAASQDGWILESGENTNVGGSANSTTTTFNLGDDAARKQYRGILSFNTAVLPDNAVITNATLRLGKQSISGGGNPLTMFQGVFIDMRKGFFGTSANLQASDFQALASKSVGPFNPTPVGTLYSINLGIPAFSYINKLATNGGLTQLRLRFKLDDNNNTVANFISFYSGNYATAGVRPVLVITYYVP